MVVATIQVSRVRTELGPVCWTHYHRGVFVADGPTHHCKGVEMNGYHWTAILFMLLIGYVIGVYFPGPGQMLRSKIGV